MDGLRLLTTDDPVERLMLERFIPEAAKATDDLQRQQAIYIRSFDMKDSVRKSIWTEHRDAPPDPELINRFDVSLLEPEPEEQRNRDIRLRKQ